MLGFSSLAATPISALPTGGVTYAREVAEAVSTLDTLQAIVGFYSALSEAPKTADSTYIGSAAFFAVVSEQNELSEITSAVNVITTYLNELASTLDSSYVGASTFTTAVEEAANTGSLVVALLNFISTVDESATASDILLARYLWELIDDTQTANWNTLPTAQSPVWTTIDNTDTASWQVIQTNI